MTAQAKVCVIGAGPAGLGFGLEYSRSGGRGLLIIDAGPPARARTCTVMGDRGCRKVAPCHVISGVGGSAVLAGGKLSELPAGRGLSDLLEGEAAASEAIVRARTTLEAFVATTPPGHDFETIEAAKSRYSALGFEMRHAAYKYAQQDLTMAWELIADEIVASGGVVATGARAHDVRRDDDAYIITVQQGGQTFEVRATALVLATGRLGADLYRQMRIPGVAVQDSRRVDVGLRIEFPAHLWPSMDRGHNDLKLHFGDARTFCASKSGWISPYRMNDLMLLEGRTDSSQVSTLSNLAVTVRFDTDAEGLMESTRSHLLGLGPGAPLRQPLADYLSDSFILPSHRQPRASFSYWRWGDVGKIYPAPINDRVREAVTLFAQRVLPEAARSQAMIFGPELDYYWPTISVVPGFRTSRHGVWAVGDAVGQFRGTLQGFASGRSIVGNVKRYLAEVTR